MSGPKTAVAGLMSCFWLNMLPVKKILHTGNFALYYIVQKICYQRKEIIMKSVNICFSALLVLFMFCGCYVRRANNHLTEVAFLDHLEHCGIDIDVVQYADASIMGAGRAVVIKLKDNPMELGLYIYDTDRQDHLKKLEFIEENGFIYIHGNKYPTLVNGSFVLIGYEKNPMKHQLIQAVETF